ncbi:nitrogen regulation protein NR(II) [Alkanindiges sp. WGS2144]|uniref:nitrogen regulation protein NR(II) n=1 Tax=Alkanindiges sp. WGS2144 TaxID=3366808 RepID=UPI00375134F1
MSDSIPSAAILSTALVDCHGLVDHMFTAIMQVSPTLHIEYLNPACETLLEISCTRAIGMPLLEVLTEPDKNFDTRAAILHTMNTGQPYTRREATLNVGLKDKIVDYTVSLIIDQQETQAIRRYVLIEIQPIDRLLRINRDEQLAKQQQVTRQLIRGVAHEIKNPLAGIRGATQLLARLHSDENMEEYTQVIISEVDRLSTLVDNMLGSRQIPLMCKVNIHEPLERVRSLILNQTGNTVQVVRDYDLSLPEVTADRDQLIQVMLNICINAAQAIQEHPDFFTAQPQIILRTRIQRLFNINGVLHRSVVRIDLQDNGPGIPASILESVFYPMVTGRANGTGLGLSIAQHIMQQHGGLIECQSAPGCTRFSLFLPWSE